MHTLSPQSMRSDSSNLYLRDLLQHDTPCDSCAYSASCINSQAFIRGASVDSTRSSLGLRNFMRCIPMYHDLMCVRAYMYVLTCFCE